MTVTEDQLVKCESHFRSPDSGPTGPASDQWPVPAVQGHSSDGLLFMETCLQGYSSDDVWLEEMIKD